MNSLNKSRLINITTGILVVSSERTILEVNPRFCEMFGYQEHELIGQSVEIVHVNRNCYENFAGWFRNVLLESGPLMQIEYRFRRKDGNLFWGLISGIKTPLPDQPNGVAWSLIDITDRKLAEQALQESELKFRTVADHTYDWEYWKATDGSLIYVSPSCERITGYAPEEFQQDPGLLTRIVHPDDLDSFRHHLELDASDPGRSDCQAPDFRILTRNGEERWIAHICQEVFDKKGRSLGRRACNRDITKRKLTEGNLLKINRQLEQANEELSVINTELEQRRSEAEETQKKLQQLSSAVVNSPAMVVITDHRGAIEYVNPKFTEITGYLPEDVAGRKPGILNAGIQPKELYKNLWDTILAGQEWRGDFCNRKNNGEIYWEHASISPLKNEQGTITHFVAIKEDVTEQKTISKDLQAARDMAEAATRSKSEFLANMSHEIRTPLNAIIGFSSLALKTVLMPHQQDYIGKIHTAGELMLNIINDILDFSKIEAGKLELEQIPFKLDTILANVLSIVQQKALDKGLKLHFGTPLPPFASHLVGDPHRLVQIIVNLLSNAIKFTEQGEVVLETALLTQQDNRLQLQFSIMDTGIGISPDQLTKLFQPFIQADGSTTRRFGGTGLGLSISKQLVEMMGGEIRCESKLEQGSIFSFTAWFGISQSNDAAHIQMANDMDRENREQAVDFSGARVLLVEDNAMNRHLVQELLKDTGAVLNLALNGKEALELVVNSDSLFDLVLMDIQMPLMDGYEATRRIRSDLRFRNLPIIAMTANVMQEDFQKISEAGMDARITKPINVQTMLKTMANFLGDQGSVMQTYAETETAIDAELVLPDIEGLVIAEALTRLGEDRKLYLWLLQSFIEEKADAAIVIQDALLAGNSAMAERMAHTVKGLAGNMGAVQLEHLAKSLENAIARHEPPEYVMTALELFSAELHRLITAIKALPRPHDP